MEYKRKRVQTNNKEEKQLMKKATKIFTIIFLALVLIPTYAVSAATKPNKDICNEKYGRWDGTACWCGTKKINLQSPTICESKMEKEYGSAIDKVIDAYNTVTNKIISACIAEGETLEDCKE